MVRSDQVYNIFMYNNTEVGSIMLAQLLNQEYIMMPLN